MLSESCGGVPCCATFVVNLLNQKRSRVKGTLDRRSREKCAFESTLLQVSLEDRFHDFSYKEYGLRQILSNHKHEWSVNPHPKTRGVN